jgi:predicted transposase YdaD
MDNEKQNTTETPDSERIAWHPAFFEAIQMELEQYRDALEFVSECQLTTEPLRIDVLIIKKAKDIVIEKNIAAMFRTVNVVEFKNPDDYVSIDDFYQVYGYACLYAALNHVPISGLTLTFVESRYPRELLKHLETERQYHIAEEQPGIYSISGDILPIQLINSRKLSADENLWLKELDNRLGVADIRRITAEIQRQGKAARIRAYLDVISKANKECLLEALKMSDTALTVEQIFEEAGIAARWEARGEARGKARGKVEKAQEIATNLLRNGFSAEQTVQLAGLTIEQVKALPVY